MATICRNTDFPGIYKLIYAIRVIMRSFCINDNNQVKQLYLLGCDKYKGRKRKRTDKLTEVHRSAGLAYSFFGLGNQTIIGFSI